MNQVKSERTRESPKTKYIIKFKTKKKYEQEAKPRVNKLKCS